MKWLVNTNSNEIKQLLGVQNAKTNTNNRFSVKECWQMNNATKNSIILKITIFVPYSMSFHILRNVTTYQYLILTNK